MTGSITNSIKNKHFHLEDSMIMYGIYNEETIEKVVRTIEQMHNKTSWN